MDRAAPAGSSWLGNGRRWKDGDRKEGETHLPELGADLVAALACLKVNAEGMVGKGAEEAGGIG